MQGRPKVRSPWLKHIFERTLVAICLVPLSIPIALVYIAVRVFSPGPAIYKQVRVGAFGKIFTMYKFRTMSLNAESNGPTWSSGKVDPRLTKIGRALRYLHLDELPQLWNVLKGEMSLIGPRPERPAFVLMLAEEVDGYLDRLAIRPGITGLAQVYLEADTSIDCVRRKILYDKLYIQSGSLLLDLKIAVCTLVRMFGVRNGKGPRWFGLNNHCVKSGLVRRTRVKSDAIVAQGTKYKPVLVFDTRTRSVVPVSVATGSRFDFESSEDFTIPSRRSPK